MRPDDCILDEEGGVHHGNSTVRWLVDLLDGTANCVDGRADYAVSVGPEVAGEPSVGAIIRPTDGQWIIARSSGVNAGRGLRSAGDREESAPETPQSSTD